MKQNSLKFLALVIAIAIWTIACQSIRLPEIATTAAPVTIKLSGWTASPVEQNLLKKLLRDFEAQHPEIAVKYEAINDQYMDVIKTRLIGEAAPDVFYLDALEAPFLMSQKVLEPLDTYLTPKFDVADFEATLINSFKYDRHLYGLPKDYSTLSLFYDRQAFKAAGLTSPPTNWEQLRNYSQQLTLDRNRDGKIDRYGYGVIPELARQAYTIGAFGGRLVEENGRAAFASEAGLKGLESIVEQYQKERTSAQKSDVGTNSGSEMLGQGKVAMAIEGNWAIPYLQETFPQLDFATAEVPSINNKKGTMVFTVAYVMNQRSQHKAAAWQLISYLTGKEGMSKWTSTGIALPSRQSVAQKLGYQQDPLRSPFVAGVEYAMPWQAGKYPAAIVNNFDNQFLSAMLGQQPLPQAMSKAQADANRQIKSIE
ncbi:ABC transporter substrate-binding protein [Chamaesiphon minutus]|uniref:ABC-type sugar transport system, periplasmic component n=1 Tax=Chamaesiphon minutus (strain ATCC 27169 / PCC 6605) TaxID=1173020 RepID=K9UAH9_CHAP6|nr:ABC transporter substrate-binding protein [Chamaesiphon minutus]AFY92122.1 ABC-type sugar transport system, periplasmic component [Chamaesiphon minutus PCC 6605]